eukprot:CAMPEP_0203761820 /NCGR_PEP_ID=MMETSP0098-20131031/14834_1 /ASSEMBLY_ACC=CAM_ASM_000208 /TAXON_ID=96639 /ORGANISM=" , Strain NY0313808BC1" /LENGTH=229 /DNA_ID=CAMNT_0050655973 /DNA_START=87 /DNA_END=776 /DNA_ORIENTATION=-
MPSRGLLRFKGGDTASSLSRGTKRKKKDTKKKKKKKKHKVDEPDSGTPTDTDEDNQDGANAKKRAKTSKPPALIDGEGAIITSNVAVTGQETKFLDELQAGDVLLVHHPTSGEQEARVVTMVLSNMSVSLSSPFSSDLMVPCAFQYLKKPKDKNEGINKDRAAKLRRKEELETAFGTYASVGNTFTYRERKSGTNASGGYQVVEQVLDKELSREELLDLRCSKKGDRNC